MKIATIIPHRNTPDLVDRQVEQISQMGREIPEFDNFTLVVDCGSDPEKRTKQPSYWYDDPDFSGKCFGHNVGLTLLGRDRFDYYWFNHPDLCFDVDKGCLEELLNVMEENPQIGVLSPIHSSGYPGRDVKTERGWHRVSTCDYLSLMVRGECVSKLGFLNPDFKYCYGAVHEYAYKVYEAGWCVAYAENAHVTHLGATTYGQPHTKTISRAEYVKRARQFAGRYFVERYGEDWDVVFSKVLPDDVPVNTFTWSRRNWERAMTDE